MNPPGETSIRDREWAVDAASRVFGDPGLLYGRMMTACVMFWFRGGPPKAEDAQFSEKTQRIFELMWLGYETWMGRGFHHYSQVAIELDRFYKRVRWALMTSRQRGDSVEDVEIRIARAASAFLLRVRELADDSFKQFHTEMDSVLQTIDSSQKGKKSEPSLSPDIT
jgi:hypothetical protein